MEQKKKEMTGTRHISAKGEGKEKVRMEYAIPVFWIAVSRQIAMICGRPGAKLECSIRKVMFKDSVD